MHDLGFKKPNLGFYFMSSSVSAVSQCHADEGDWAKDQLQGLRLSANLSAQGISQAK